MKLTGMVGVGNQDSSGPGASACVCALPRSSGSEVAAAGTSASVSAVVVALQEEERRAQEAARQASIR